MRDVQRTLELANSTDVRGAHRA